MEPEKKNQSGSTETLTIELKSLDKFKKIVIKDADFDKIYNSVLDLLYDSNVSFCVTRDMIIQPKILQNIDKFSSYSCKCGRKAHPYFVEEEGCDMCYTCDKKITL